MEMGFGERGKLRAFHVDVRPLAIDRNGHGDASVGENGGELRAGGLIECDVGDQSVAEERGDAALGAVEKLVGHKKFAGAQILLQRADGANGNNALDAEKLHRVDVGAEVQFARKNSMAAAMAGKEGDALAFESAENDFVGRVAKRGFDA